jgi:hypothetical protein
MLIKKLPFRHLLFLFIIFLNHHLLKAANYSVSNLGDNGGVNPAVGAGSGTLRQAIVDANNIAGPHTISFSVAGTITLSVTLPKIIRAVTIDGSTAPGYVSGTPVIEISGNSSSISPIIWFDAGSTGSAANYLVINKSNAGGIYINSTGGVNVKGCFVGTTLSGLVASPNADYGIIINGSNGCTIGGTTSQDRNIISGNTTGGVHIANNSDNNNVKGNYIGLDKTGNTKLANNGHGVVMDAGSDANNILNNVISGNGTYTGSWPGPTTANGSGINILSSVNNSIKGNYIGLGADGSINLGNTENGINVLNSSTGTIIGGTALADRNFIGGHGFHGINLQSTISKIKNNYIGTDITGTLNRGNQGSGILVIVAASSSPRDTIGGTGTYDGNVLVNSVNEYGLRFQNTTNFVVKGNFIGTDRTRTYQMGNNGGGIGIYTYSSPNTASIIIGGDSDTPASNEGNTIAYNGGDGIKLFPVGGTVDQINYRANKIYCNVGVGINNNGTNGALVPPVITSRTTTSISGTGSGAGNKVVHVYLNATSGTNCDCEGEIYLGTTTGGSGASWTWTFTFPAGYTPLTAAQYNTITATRSASGSIGETSEFSSCVAIPLPVEWVDFKVAKEQTNAILVWKTIWENNNEYFYIEKSSDGINFSEIGKLPGKGTSSDLNTYAYMDVNPSGTNYYRIRQVDINGKYSYTKIQSYTSDDNVIVDPIEVYPNPSTGKIIISSLITLDNCHIELLDVAGKVVFEEMSNIEGMGNVKYDFSNAEPGVYYVVINNDTDKWVKKLVIRK